jgi:predicted DNA-binding protein YlxM (UPF0122 family)
MSQKEVAAEFKVKPAVVRSLIKKTKHSTDFFQELVTLDEDADYQIRTIVEEAEDTLKQSHFIYNADQIVQ